MSESKSAQIGVIGWRDLTVENAEEVRHFYTQVVGWETAPHDMGDYNDYDVRIPATGETAAGICHARGSNANVPPQWLLYVMVESVAASAAKCLELGGAVVDGPRTMGGIPFCVIQDPAGAVIALMEIQQDDSPEA